MDSKEGSAGVDGGSASPDITPGPLPNGTSSEKMSTKNDVCTMDSGPTNTDVELSESTNETIKMNVRNQSASRNGSESRSVPDLTVEFKLNGKNGASQSQPLLNGLHIENTSTGLSRNSVYENKEGSILSFHKLGYKVKVPPPGSRCACGKKEDNHILKNLSGLCRPGMNAILGPTGSGKTSLLDVLAGRKDPAGLTGHVLVDGQHQPSNFKCMAGYVIQDDIVVGMLTVRENIHFSAALRLPKTVNEEQRTQRVEDVISELGLSDCADTKIGTALKRGVSGGERKRTNIAMELITAPPVLFLDEPTTGLDATTAYSVMYLLKRLSRKGTTIVFSIHQPRYSIYKLFDDMLLLNQGEIVYQGPTREALDYFSSIGHVCEEHNNPSDFFLDVINDMSAPAGGPQLKQIEINSPKPVKSAEENELILAIEEENDPENSRHQQLVQGFKQSKWYSRTENELKPIEEKYVSGTDPKRSKVSYPTSMCRQMQIVGGRTFWNMIRNFHTLTTQVFSAIILSVLVGSIYFQVDKSCKSGLQNRVGAFFFIVVNFVFSNMTAMDMFLKDRLVFIHENISGYYRVSVYFFSKLLCDVIPQRVLPILVFASISYWMIGLSPDVVQFLFFTLNIFLTSMAGTSIPLVFSATVSNGSIGSLFSALVWVTMMVFSGLLVNIDTVPAWLRWIKWLSIFHYSMNAFNINELKNLTFCDNCSTNTTITCDSGVEYMDKQGIPHQTLWDLWFNEVMLVVIGTCFLAITYIQLRRLMKLK